MSRRARHLLVTLPLALYLAGCGTAVRHDRPAAAEDPAYGKITSAMQAGDYAHALPLLEKRVAAAPEDIDSSVNLAIAYRETGDLEKALETLETAAEKAPDNAAVQHQLGIVHRQLGHFDHALEAYKNAIRIDSGYALPHRNLGVLYDIYLQQPDAALAEYQRYLELTGSEDKEVAGWVADLKRRSVTAQARSK